VKNRFQSLPPFKCNLQRYIVAAEASLEVTNAAGKIPLHLAVEAGDLKVRLALFTTLFCSQNTS
jgi:hypothetical protein